MSQLLSGELFDILIGKISTTINRTILRAFASENIEITTEQWTVLASLSIKDEVTQQELCNTTLKDKPSMTRLIDKLEQRKLVIRLSDQPDRRVNIIKLTNEGKRIQDKATLIVQNIASKTLSNITPEELDLSRNVLRKIMSNLK